jgi:hypothetical protein
MDNDIFISYTQPDRNKAFAIHDMLQVKKIRSWIAPSGEYGIQAGVYYEGPIVNAIESCKIFILVYSRFVNESDHVIRELRHKRKEQKLLLVKLDNSDYRQDLSYYLKGLQYINSYTQQWQEVLKELLSRIKKELDNTNNTSLDNISTDQFLFSNGKDLLKKKIYNEAEKFLAQYVSIEPDNSSARFFLALSLMKGRKSKKIDSIEVKNIERVLLPCLNSEKSDHIKFLLAIVKYGYYTLNGFRETSPCSEELVADITSLDTEMKEMAGTILYHLSEPDNRRWSNLMDLYNR